MPLKHKTCLYCSSTVYKGKDICNNCEEKLKLLRRLREIIFELKKQAEEEREEDDCSGN